MSATRYVDEFLEIMHKIGFVDPAVNPQLQASPSDEDCVAEILFSWISKVTTVDEAKEKGIKIGRLAYSHTVAKEINPLDVMKMLDRCGDWYSALRDRIDMEAKQERDDILVGRKFERTAEAEEKRQQLKKISRFMMNLLSAATQEIDRALESKS